jgi:hypothetical protein
MKFVNWFLKLYPAVRSALDPDRINDYVQRAEIMFPRRADGIRRGAEKLEWVRQQLERGYEFLNRYGPAFERVWVLALPLIERSVRRMKDR